MQHHRRRHAIAAGKILLAAAILGYLVVKLNEQQAFSRLVEEEKQWGLLLAAQGLVLLAFAISCVRWFILVRGLDIHFPLPNAFRLGALGFLLSQVSLGSIGGDLFKAVFIAREQPERKTHAVASVVIDRVVGLYAMLLVATAGVIVAGGAVNQSNEIRTMALVIAVGLVAGTILLGALLTPAATGSQLKSRAARLPLVGPTLERLFEAAEMYQNRRAAVYTAILFGVCTHCLLIAGIGAISNAIPIVAPEIADLVVVVPLSLFVGAIPATPGGLGTFEATMEGLYRLVGSGDGDGTLAALTYRVATYGVATVGAVYYLSSRKRIDEALHDAEELADAGEVDPTSSELM